MVVIYVVDTSEWINLFQRYPETVFPSLWVKIENLISSRRVASLKVVLDEIERSSDADLVKWCKSHLKILRKIDDLAGPAKKIMNEHHPLTVSKKRYESADPYVIALAKFYKDNLSNETPIIVTDENDKRVSGIPYVARDYDIQACKLLEMFKMEGWKF